MREFDRRAFAPLLPPRREELEAIAGEAAHFLSVNFALAFELTKQKPEPERFTAEEYYGEVAEHYACAWTLAHCRHLGLERTTEKLLLLSRVFEKTFHRSSLEAVVRADEAYRRYLRAVQPLKAMAEAGAFSADDAPTAETLAFHAMGRAMESAARLADEADEGEKDAVIGPEIATLEELLSTARRFASAP
jgi:hypothetical protein